MPNWFLLRNNETYGPYPEEQIREWVRAGQILPEEKLIREGDTNWMSLDMIPEFAADQPAKPLVPVGGYTPPYAGPMSTYQAAPPKDKTVAGVLAILLGGLGVHHFYLGNIGIGIVYVLLLCVSISPILGLIDGIIYMTKREDQFQRNYHNWFCSGP